MMCTKQLRTDRQPRAQGSFASGRIKTPTWSLDPGCVGCLLVTVFILTSGQIYALRPPTSHWSTPKCVQTHV